MTKEVLQGKVVSEGKVAVLEFQQELSRSNGLLRFQKQQVTNLKIKEEMARELTAMDLPEDAIHEILHIEDELPF